MDRMWLHEHLGTVFRARSSGNLWMLVSVEADGIVRFRTQTGDLMKCFGDEFGKSLRRGDFEETNEVWA